MSSYQPLLHAHIHTKHLGSKIWMRRKRVRLNPQTPLCGPRQGICLSQSCPGAKRDCRSCSLHPGESSAAPETMKTSGPERRGGLLQSHRGEGPRQELPRPPPTHGTSPARQTWVQIPAPLLRMWGLCDLRRPLAPLSFRVFTCQWGRCCTLTDGQLRKQMQRAPGCG